MNYKSLFICTFFLQLLSWMQHKLNGRNTPKNTQLPSPGFGTHEASKDTKSKEDNTQWQHGLLAIGTLGNNDLKEDGENQELNKNGAQELEEMSEFTAEEIAKLQKELTRLLAFKPSSGDACSNNGGENSDCPLKKFLSCPSTLNLERRYQLDATEDRIELREDSNCSSTVRSKGKDVCVDNKSVICQRSISFLLKKMFVCRSGFAPVPSLRYPLPESRMEKLLRTILHRRIYPQSTSTSSRKYLSSKSMAKSETTNEEQGQGDSCRWVKTDSDFIVLEM
ncbi:hypothetical protein AMTRI_Chr12g267120 [Amborella trichopoda]